MKLSIVIPTLNEQLNLPRLISQTLQDAIARPQLIVSDCNSADETLAIARRLADGVTEGASSRAAALNRGATLADGDVLLFLHADTLLPPAFDRLIGRALARSEVVGGAFDFTFGSHPLSRGAVKQSVRVVQFINRIRFRSTGTFFGDQAIFVRRGVFNRIGGFQEIPLMEDVRFSRALAKFGKTAILSPPVKTSPRRFVTRGVVRQLVTDAILLLGEDLGVNPRALWRNYNAWNRCASAPEIRRQAFKDRPTISRGSDPSRSPSCCNPSPR